MNLEQAQELYSEYYEGNLSPALRLAFEQHMATDEQIRDDYSAFAAVYAFTAKGLLDQVDVPSGFRDSVLAKISDEKKNRSFTTANSVRRWFLPSDMLVTKKLTGGAIAAMAAAIVAVSVFHGHSQQPGSTASFVPTAPALVAPTPVIQGVSEEPGTDGSTYHIIHIHLPQTVAQAKITANRVTGWATPANAVDAPPLGQTVLKQPKMLTNDEQLLIPVAFAGATPDGTTLNVYVQWQPSVQGASAGSEVVFTPAKNGPSTTVLVAPTRGSLYDMLQYISAEYGVTIVADPDILANTVSVQWPAQTDAAAALQSISSVANAAIKQTSPGTYLVYRLR